MTLIQHPPRVESARPRGVPGRGGRFLVVTTAAVVAAAALAVVWLRRDRMLGREGAATAVMPDPKPGTLRQA